MPCIVKPSDLFRRCTFSRQGMRGYVGAEGSMQLLWKLGLLHMVFTCTVSGSLPPMKAFEDHMDADQDLTALPPQLLHIPARLIEVIKESRQAAALHPTGGDERKLKV
ncbi:hypothetical protein WJX73_010847 [Symbiochloris irregularis]|uniref:Uncharacterized protein n=1 Tax=Symbiochloris irregularis TaxID=706552 RepID=A0AAW1PCG4_9CHLO